MVGVVAVETAGEADREAINGRFEYQHGNIDKSDTDKRGLEEGGKAGFLVKMHIDISAKHGDQSHVGSQDGNHASCSQYAADDQELKGVGGRYFHGFDLFGDLHRSQFGTDMRPD